MDVYILIPRVGAGVTQYSVWLRTGRLGDRGSIPGRSKRIFPVASVQAGPGADPASYPMGTEGPFPGGKVRPGRDTDHSPPSSAEGVSE
jgi:hypothetical protein